MAMSFPAAGTAGFCYDPISASTGTTAPLGGLRLRKNTQFWPDGSLALSHCSRAFQSFCVRGHERLPEPAQPPKEIWLQHNPSRAHTIKTGAKKQNPAQRNLNACSVRQSKGF